MTTPNTDITPLSPIEVAAAQAGTDHVVVNLWESPLLVGITKFKHKSLADFTLNNFVGCSHGCTFCYVPEISTIRLKRILAKYGITDPDLQWGKYQFLRSYDIKKFLASLKTAQYHPEHELLLGGHRAVFVSTTTDAWAPIMHPNRERAQALREYRDKTLTQALELIRDKTDLNVRILTRSYYLKQGGFFPLLKSFGPRLMLGTSLPCLNEKLLRAYEPMASAPGKRLQMLNEAREEGIATYVAIAPVYPEMTDDELREVMVAVRDAGVMTAFMEPINMRADNLERIQRGFVGTGIEPKHDVFKQDETNVSYSMDKMHLAERIAAEVGIADRLHLWPDQGLLESAAARKVIKDWDAHQAWLHKWWNRVSEWPDLSKHNSSETAALPKVA